MIIQNNMKLPCLKIQEPDGTISYVKYADFQSPTVAKRRVFWHNYLWQRVVVGGEKGGPLPDINDMKILIANGTGSDPEEGARLIEFDDWDSYGEGDGINITYDQKMSFLNISSFVSAGIGIGAEWTPKSGDPTDFYSLSRFQKMVTLSSSTELDWFNEWPPKSTNHYKMYFGVRLQKPLISISADPDQPGSYTRDIYNPNSVSVNYEYRDLGGQWHGDITSTYSIPAKGWKQIDWQSSNNFPYIEATLYAEAYKGYLPSETVASGAAADLFNIKIALLDDNRTITLDGDSSQTLDEFLARQGRTIDDVHVGLVVKKHNRSTQNHTHYAWPFSFPSSSLKQRVTDGWAVNFDKISISYTRNEYYWRYINTTWEKYGYNAATFETDVKYNLKLIKNSINHCYQLDEEPTDSSQPKHILIRLRPKPSSGPGVVGTWDDIRIGLVVGIKTGDTMIYSSISSNCIVKNCRTNTWTLSSTSSQDPWHI